MYRTVLLAYDSSLEGARALREGALIARACGARVVLLSVVPNTAGLQMAEGVYGGCVAQQLESYKDLLKRATAWLEARGFQPTARIAIGEPAPMIGKVAREVEADLVVVGHHRTKFLARWWSGSTNAYLCDTVGCSVLIASNSLTDEAFDASLQRMSAT